MRDVEVILPNMRGACVTVDKQTHVLLRVTSSTAPMMAKPADHNVARDPALLPTFDR